MAVVKGRDEFSKTPTVGGVEVSLSNHNHDASYAAAGHNHDSDYISVIGTPDTGNFPTISAGGELVTSAYGPSDFAAIGHDHAGVYEPVFTKNTGFNKNFGTTSGTVSEGDHTHAYIPTSEKAAANGVATLGADSKIPSAQLPAIAISDTFVVASQVAMLALTAQTGDLAVRTDENKTYILQGTDPSILGHWQELLTPTDAVTSVNGYTGVITLTTTDIAEGTNLYYTEGRVSANTSVAANTSHRGDATLHRTINDAGAGVTDLWSASKITTELSGKSDTSHNHAGVYEPVFTKNTGFNKDFGTIAGTVSEGNHNHNAAYSAIDHTHAMNDISDANVGTPATGDVIRWNGAAWSKYPDSNYAASGHNHDADYAALAHAHNLNDISDVSAAAPSVGDLIRWSGAGWVSYADSAYAASGHNHDGSYAAIGHGHTYALNDLSNVDETGKTTNDYLKWNGASWVPAPATAVSALDDLTDVTITTPVDGDHLMYNGANWVNEPLETGGSSTTITVWTLDSGDLYQATFAHNLNTTDVAVFCYNTVNSKRVYPEDEEIIDANNIKIWVRGNTHSIKVNVVSGLGPRGPGGADGAEWFNGAGAPAGGTGEIGDYYINNSNGDYYEKTGVSTWTLRGNLEGPAGTGTLNNVVEDTTPQLGGDLDMNLKNIQYSVPTADLTSSGIIVTAQVDSNATGFGAALYMAADGNFDEADADAAATMPCRAIALESGVGSKKVLLQGFVRNNAWNWTPGQGLFISTTTGALTQTAPSGTGDQVQKIGFAWTGDIVYFVPGDYTIIEVA